MVMYAEIYDKNKLYMGPRKLDQAAQATFTFPWGEGGPVLDFFLDVNPQDRRGGGESGESETSTVNLRRRAEATAAKEDAAMEGK